MTEFGTEIWLGAGSQRAAPPPLDSPSAAPNVRRLPAADIGDDDETRAPGDFSSGREQPSPPWELRSSGGEVEPPFAAEPSRSGGMRFDPQVIPAVAGPSGGRQVFDAPDASRHDEPGRRSTAAPQPAMPAAVAAESATLPIVYFTVGAGVALVVSGAFVLLLRGGGSGGRGDSVVRLEVSGDSRPAAMALASPPVSPDRERLDPAEDQPYEWTPPSPALPARNGVVAVDPILPPEVLSAGETAADRERQAEEREQAILENIFQENLKLRDQLAPPRRAA